MVVLHWSGLYNSKFVTSAPSQTGVWPQHLAFGWRLHAVRALDGGLRAQIQHQLEADTATRVLFMSPVEL